MFDIVNFSKKRINRAKKLNKKLVLEFKYIPKQFRLKYLFHLVKLRVNLEEKDSLQNRFYYFFSKLAILGKNDFFYDRRNSVYTKILKLKNKIN